MADTLDEKTVFGVFENGTNEFDDAMIEDSKEEKDD